MRVLVACEYSGRVRDAFTKLGHHAVSCDLLPSVTKGIHYQGDVRELLDGWEPVQFQADCDNDGDGWCKTKDCDPNDCECLGPTQDGVEYKEVNGVLLGRVAPWDMLLAFPPCTHLAVSGARHFAAKKEDGRQQEGIDFFMLFANSNCKRVAIENPVGIMSSVWRKPDQVIQPWMFGEEKQKTTCLWLKNLPQLKPTNIVGRGEFTTFKSGKRHPKWYADALKLPADERSSVRSATFQGIADAMAAQWGKLED